MAVGLLWDLNGAARRPRVSEVGDAWCGYGLREEFAGASLWMRQQTAGEAVVSSAVGARCDTGTPCVPEQVSRSRLEDSVPSVQWYLEVAFFDRSNRHNDEDRSAQHKRES